MKNTTNIIIGDVILANFPYEDDATRFKKRPAVVMQVMQNKLSVVALKITTTPPRDKHDYQLISWALAGLNKASTVRTSKKTIITVSSIIKVLGTLSATDFNMVNKLFQSL